MSRSTPTTTPSRRARRWKRDLAGGAKAALNSLRTTRRWIVSLFDPNRARASDRPIGRKCDSCSFIACPGEATIPRPGLGEQGEFVMKLRTIFAGVAALLFTTVVAFCQDEHEGHAGHGEVGSVTFANSCGAAVQGELASAVAMLHSLWVGGSEPDFANVLA